MGETIRLADGRALGFDEFGAHDGAPVFYLPGYGSSRLAAYPDDALTASTGARVIAVDRPGIGLSSPRAGYRPLDFATDVVALADALGQERFAVLGWSWGGAYALACGYGFPERVTRLGLASPLGRWLVGPGATTAVSSGFRQLALLVRLAPRTLKLFLRWQRRGLLRDPERAVARATASLPLADREVVERPGMRTMLVANLLAAWRQGSDGLYQDTLAVARPWGFQPGEVGPPVHLWQGEDDAEVLPAMAHELVAALPDCRASFCMGEGHLVIYIHWAEMLSALVA
ncbi:MAG TPA: alpha/beta hydrolase [Thermomicrobiaceae bacterium]|nr:alpha/beta hydrolase [Thermomicrobiaceae bacterium]